MRLPCVLLIEPEMPEGVSARKLVLETAKINVISAYTAETGLSNFEDFPNVDAVVLHSESRGMHYAEIMERIRQRCRTMRFIIVTPHTDVILPSENVVVVDSNDPTSLLFMAQQWLDELTDSQEPL